MVSNGNLLACHRTTKSGAKVLKANYIIPVYLQASTLARAGLVQLYLKTVLHKVICIAFSRTSLDGWYGWSFWEA
jgi:hypothetical protein